MSPPSDVDVNDEQKPTLTPPASEEADKQYDSGSELSELELEPEDKPEDNGEIEPDHYYDEGKIPVFKPVRCAYKPTLPFLSRIANIVDIWRPGFRSRLTWCSVDRQWTNSGASSRSFIRSTSMV